MSRRCRSSLMSLVVVVVLLVVTGGCASEEASESAETEAAPAQETEDAPAQETAASPSATAASPDPCSLLTAEEIETETGIAPRPGEAISGACTWAAADGSNPRLLTLTVLQGNVTREQWLSGGGTEDEIVEGIGDFAAWVGSQLQVYQDGWMVGVAVRGSDRPEAAQDLARAVHARLED